MELTFLNTNFETVFVLDASESVLWVDRYYEPGSFELSTPLTDDLLAYTKANFYIKNADSEHAMIIEDISLDTDDGVTTIKAVGRSLESILDRRIIWKATRIKNMSFSAAVEKLLNENVINPTIEGRKISNFIFDNSLEDAYISNLTVNYQFEMGDSLLADIQNMCLDYHVGFKITLNNEHQFVFQLYNGIDRSYSQTSNAFVLFSTELDNIIDTIYADKTTQTKNVALVLGGTNNKTKIVGSNTGLNRRELYVNASDIKQDDITLAAYLVLLEKRGVSELDNLNRRTTFDSNCDSIREFVYGKDFKVGDIVQVVNEFGMEAACRITEFTWSYQKNDISTYPTFLTLDQSIITGKNKLGTTLSNLKSLNSSSGEWDDNVWTNGDIVVTVNLDAYGRVNGIGVDGKNNLSSALIFDLGQVMVEEGTLIMSGCSGGTSATYKLVLRDTTSNADKATNYDGDTPLSSIDLSHNNHVRFVIASKKEVNNITLYPMVRTAEESSGFEPYAG